MADVRLPGTGTGSFEWWSAQLEWAADVRTDALKDWRHSVDAYRDELKALSADAIRVNIEYEKTEQKKHQLFFRTPTLRLSPTARTLRDGMPGPNGEPARDVKRAVRVFREVLQRLAGPKGVDTQTLMQQNLFDVLCPAGFAACKIGYERFEQGTVPVQVGEEPIPGGQPGSILGLGPTPMQPVYEPAPNVIHERYFASRISPARLLKPADFLDGEFSRDALFLGHDFFIDRADAVRKGWKIPREVKGSSVDDDEFRIVPVRKAGSRRDQLKGREVFYFAQKVDGSVPHPLLIRRLVLIEGMEEPVISEDLKDQRFDNRGKLVGGLTSLPIKVLTLRYVSDSGDPPSDCRISRRQGDELSEFRSLQVVHRKKSVPMRWMDFQSIADEKVKEQVKRGEYYDIIPTDGPGDKVMGEVARAQYPRENNQFIDYLRDDVDRQWAMGGNASGVTETSGRTATELSLLQKATQTRFAGEQGAVTRYWLSIMEGLGELVQLYADREDYIEITGQRGAEAIEAWDKDTIRGEYLYDIIPDSSAPVDAAQERDLALNRYNLLANDPNINREELVRQTVEAFNADPDLLVKPVEPPTPEPPKVSVSIKGEDLIPFAPQYKNIITLLELNGVGSMEQPQEPTGPAAVVDRERLRMAEADNGDQRSPGGLVGA